MSRFSAILFNQCDVCNAVTVLQSNPRHHWHYKSITTVTIIITTVNTLNHLVPSKDSNYPISECFHWDGYLDHPPCCRRAGRNQQQHQHTMSLTTSTSTCRLTSKQPGTPWHYPAEPLFTRHLQRKQGCCTDEYVPKHTIQNTKVPKHSIQREQTWSQLFCSWWVLRRQTSMLEVAFKWGLRLR